MRLWSEDESRCGLLPIIRRRITAKGVPPLIQSNFQFESFYLFGAVEPATGDRFLLELPSLNSENYQIFLDHFARHDPESFHLLLVDNAAFHEAQTLRLPENVGHLFLPAYSPELNPIERFWRDLKDYLAPHQPQSLDQLSELIVAKLQQYTAKSIKSLTAFAYLLTAWEKANA